MKKIGKKTLKPRFVIGIDEVGRGPLAGPVAVGAVGVTRDMLRKFRTIKESKQLSAEKREVWTKEILRVAKEQKSELRTAVTMVSAKEIDTHGIVSAIKKALTTSIKKLNINPNDCEVLLDGGLKAPLEYKKQRTIIRGDASKTAIAMASVIAKVKRDTYMTNLDKKYPNYGFAQHKGYGTKEHYRALKRKGISPLHRKSFLKSLHTA